MSQIVVPVISLWQPYASLIMRWVKLHETRSWPLPKRCIGATVAIHATAKFPSEKHISDDLHELCMDVFGCGYNHSLPQGAILGTVKFTGSHKTEEWQPANDEDRIAGDWGSGRYAWPMMHITSFPYPIFAKGKQGWWKHDISELADFLAATTAPAVADTRRDVPENVGLVSGASSDPFSSTRKDERA